MNTRIGVIYTPSRGPEGMRRFAERAEAAGLDEVLLFEDCFRESGVAAATALLAWTERIRIGVGVLPMPFRKVALLAMEAATIERLFPGRFRLGVGHGVQDWMGQAGARHASPLTLMREYVTALRALLAGRRLTVEGRYVRLADVGLDWPPAAPLPVHAAGEGPKTIALTGEVADGTILTTGTSPASVADAVASIRSARAAAGRDGEHEVTVFVMTAFGERAEERLEGELAEWGYTSGRAVGAAGTVAEVADAVRAYLRAGADTVLLQPLDDEAELDGFVDACAEVAALVRG